MGTEDDMQAFRSMDEEMSLVPDNNDEVRSFPASDMYAKDGLEGLQRLKILSQPENQSSIPFGIDGTSVHLNRYGEIMRMTTIGHDVIRLRTGFGSDAQTLHYHSEDMGTGLGVCMRPYPSNTSPSLSWVHGRWPYIQYTCDGLYVSVLLKIEDGVLSQQMSIANPFEQERTVKFGVPIRNCKVERLRSESGLWTTDDRWHLEEFSCHRTAPGSYKCVEYFTSPDRQRVEALISIYYDGKVLELKDTLVQSAFDESITGTGQSPWAGSLLVQPNDVKRLVVQYRLGQYQKDGPVNQEFKEIEKFLRAEQSLNWCFSEEDEFNIIYRRHLEHILCLCLVIKKSEPRAPVPFVNDTTLESGSTPLGDFQIFRYLLMMYQILGEDKRIVSTSTPGAPEFSRSGLQYHIRDVCKRHLRWSFSDKVMMASCTWPSPPASDNGGSDTRNGLNEKAFNGSLQLLKLAEYHSVFGDEDDDLVKDCLASGAVSWINTLHNARDYKSNLWHRDRLTYIAWEGGRTEGSQWLNLPEYRLGDVIYIWRALQWLEDIARKTESKSAPLEKIRPLLKRHQLQCSEVRNKILQRFIYQPHTIWSCGPQNQAYKTADGSGVATSETEADSFLVAVRRSRGNDNHRLYAKDTTLYDGLKWEFFDGHGKDEHQVDSLNAKSQMVKVIVDVNRAWERTLQAQGDSSDDTEDTWENPLRYGLAIAMAKHGYSLDKSNELESLVERSRERLLRSVLSHGQFADRLRLDEHHLVSFRFPPNLKLSLEIPTLLLRLRFEGLDIVAPREEKILSVRDSPIEKRGSEVDRASMQVLCSEHATAIRKKKKAALAKRKTRGDKEADQNQVFDPPERKLKDWMYPLPDFIEKLEPYNMDHIESMWREDLGNQLLLDRNNELDPNDQKKLGSILDKGIHKWKSVNEDFRRERSFSAFNFNAVVIDVDELRQSRQRSRTFNTRDRTLDAEDFDELLRERRRKDKKKRFYYIAPLRFEHALILYLSSPNSDKLDMAQFYLRHSDFKSHLHEDIHPLADVWATELHLSFFQLAKTKSNNDEIVDSRDELGHMSDSICNQRQWDFPSSVKGPKLQISTASVSYRIIGDMGDKFWNCYLLAFLPAESIKPTVLGYPDFQGWDDKETDVHDWFIEDFKNHQRKVFEPFVVEKMAAEAHQSTYEILEPIFKWIYEPETSTMVTKADDRYIGEQRLRSKICLELDSILKRLKNLSKSNIESLDSWKGREKNRNYKPRWSEKDELKYRDRIDYQERRALQQISSVRDQHEEIQILTDLISSHRQELINNISLAESQRAAHNSENIRVFTYATVVFYPLSFVVGLFSMQGLPDRATTAIFLQGTAVALVVTLCIVFNAETLAWPVRRLRYSIRKMATRKMEKTENPFPFSWKDTLDRIREAEETDILHHNQKPKLHRDNLLYIFFLIVHLVIDFPSSCIGRALELTFHMDEIALDRIVLAVVRILIALAVLPLYIAGWMIVLSWVLLSRILGLVTEVPSRKWTNLKTKTDKEVDAKIEADVKAKFEKDSHEQQYPPENRRNSLAQEQPKAKKETADMSPQERMIAEAKMKKRTSREKRVQHLSSILHPPRHLMPAGRKASGDESSESSKPSRWQEIFKHFSGHRKDVPNDPENAA